MKLTALLLLLVPLIFIPVSCSKTGGIPPPPPPDPCLMINMGLSGTVTNPSVDGAADGSIIVTVSPAAGTGLSFGINGGAFQSSGNFRYLAAGDYTVIAKNAEGCTSSVSFRLSNPTTLCAGVNIMVSPVATSNIPCEVITASITVSASGGLAPYSYSLNSGSYQATNVFTNLATGSYIVTVKDANGCTGTSSTTVNNAAAGPMFMQVRSLVQSHCLYCHGSVVPSGGVSYSEDCNIVANKMRIKARAVDGIPSPMPTTGLLPVSDRQKIIDWINAGGRYSD